MRYSMDLKERVLKFVNDGGSQQEAAKMFNVTSRSIYNWLHRRMGNAPRAVTRRRKLDKHALDQHLTAMPEARLVDRARHFGVSHVAVWKALRVLKARKKNGALH